MAGCLIPCGAKLLSVLCAEIFSYSHKWSNVISRDTMCNGEINRKDPQSAGSGNWPRIGCPIRIACHGY